MKNSLILVAVAMLAVVMAGCRSAGMFESFNDQDREGMIQVAQEGVVYPQRVSVMKFNDLRGTAAETGSFYWSLCPLMPYGWVSYDRPEEGYYMVSLNLYKFEMARALAFDAAYCLDYSRLFQAHYLSGPEVLGSQDLILEADLLAANYDGRVITYCISAAGPVLWVVGAPASTANHELNVKFKLRHSSGKVIWEYPVKVTMSEWQWLYFGMGDNRNAYRQLMVKAMNEAIPDLQKKLQENPALLKAK